MVVDHENEDPLYWEQILESNGLGLSRGFARQIVYIGGQPEYERLEEDQQAGREGQLENGGHRVTPEGRGPDA